MTLVKYSKGKTQTKKIVNAVQKHKRPENIEGLSLTILETRHLTTGDLKSHLGMVLDSLEVAKS